MLKIQLQDIQSISSTEVIIPDNSIVEFTGENSNGKSIISKVIERLVSGDLRNKEIRKTIIKDGRDEGIILFTSDQYNLLVDLKEELGQSTIGLKRIEDTEWIARPLSDSNGCAELVYTFGFRSYSKGDICLQLAPTFGAIPFITTSGATNAEIVQDITTDKVADEFLTTFKSITFPILKDVLAKKKIEASSLQTIIDNLHAYDWKAYEEIRDKMKPIYLAISNYQETTIDEIPIPPLNIYPYKETTIRNIPVVKFHDIFQPIDGLSEYIESYNKIANGVCPTCNRPLMEDSCVSQ